MVNDNIESEQTTILSTTYENIQRAAGVHNRRPIGNLTSLRKALHFPMRSVIIFPIVFRTILHLNVYENE